MTTNKVMRARINLLIALLLMLDSQKKATNFYSAANVKNKNRQKATLMKKLQKGAVNDRKRRR